MSRLKVIVLKCLSEKKKGNIIRKGGIGKNVEYSR